MDTTGHIDDQDLDAAYAAARAADAAADRRLLAALRDADTDDALVTHDSTTACSLGTWHTGTCQP